MNDKSFNSALLLAILLTLMAVLAQQFFPEKRFTIWPNPQSNSYFYSFSPQDAAPAAFWLDQQNSILRCTYPQLQQNEYFACSFNVLFEKAKGRGVDLSSYTHLKLKLNYSGSAHRMRISIRNFDPIYSTVQDSNSTKFNALTLHTRDLNKELLVNLHEFSVADWWISNYDIPRELAYPDFRNVMSLGIDYVEGMKPGNHDMQIEKIEFVGEWITAEHWYLLILGAWMLGIFCYAISRLIQLQHQSRHDTHVINQLSSENTQLSQETDRFRRLSTIDPLTQVYNRFGIDQIISSLMSLNQERDAHKDAPDFALMIIDIDHFKRINDHRGHDAGDRILQQVSLLIRQGIRKQDFLGRWGGEEFIVIMPSTDKERAFSLAEQIRLLIYNTQFETDNPLSVSASFGISEKQQDEDFATTFKRADNALYAAKAQGRNCCVMAEDKLNL